ncbi:hypothetical protein RQN30_10940 [Arcanobacterium hippocoleae]
MFPSSFVCLGPAISTAGCLRKVSLMRWVVRLAAWSALANVSGGVMRAGLRKWRRNFREHT